MSWGYGAMGATSFVGYVTAVMFGAAILIPFAYWIATKRGRRAGFVWLGSVVGIALAAVVGIFLWAAASGQLAAFVGEFGVDPFVEIGVFTLLIWIITGFPTFRGVFDMER